MSNTSNLSKLEFVALDITGDNYLLWTLDAKIHLTAKSLGDTIKDGTQPTDQDKVKVMIFLRRHLHEDLKREYLTIENPLKLWNNLKERFDHQKLVILPKARYDWLHLRLQDYKSVSEYNSALFRITSELKLCGENITDEDMLEKTYSTFHASNMLLSQQYRERKFTKYSELISCLLVAEQNNKLLLRNHQARPVGATHYQKLMRLFVRADVGERGRGRSNSRGRGRGRGRHFTWRREPHFSRPTIAESSRPNRGRNHNGQHSGTHKNACYHCGMTNQWSRTCRTPQHLVDAYQQMIKGRGVETNLLEDAPTSSNPAPVSDVHLDTSDFLDN